MPRKHDRLFDDIASFPALLAAAKAAVKGKRNKAGPARFLANLEPEILRLERELRNRTYRTGRFRTIRIRDPKPRLVSAAPFRDRVVHHALCKVIEPIFERGFIADTYANRRGKGTHKAVDRYEGFRDRYRYVLRGDIYRYFPSIDHAILKRDLRRRIACSDTMWLIDRIIDGSNPQEPVHHYFPGDDLFAPFNRRRGLPIGNLTSQFFANIYLDRLDHFAKEHLGARGYVRYVDDFALFHDDAAVLEAWWQAIARFLEGRRLSLHPRKTRIEGTDRPAIFLGYELWPDRRRLPDANVRRFRNRLRGLRDRWRAGSISLEDVDRRVASWIGHACHADTWRLRQAIFRGGRYDPSREPDRSPARTASCAAVPGTTNRGTCARPTATGTTPANGTTTTGSALPAHPVARAAAIMVAPGAPWGVQERS